MSSENEAKSKEAIHKVSFELDTAKAILDGAKVIGMTRSASSMLVTLLSSATAKMQRVDNALAGGENPFGS